MQTNNILILSYSDFSRDPRVQRQLKALKGNKITEAGLKSSEHGNPFERIGKMDVRRFFILRNCTYYFFYERISTQIFLKFLKLYRFHYWSLYRLVDLRNLSSATYDLIIANDIDTLPLAIALKKRTGAKVFFDAHEYAPLEYENDSKWLRFIAPFNTYLCKEYIKLADAHSTIGEFIAREYQKLTNVQFDVVLNAPEYHNLSPGKVKESRIKFIHHGVASPVRELERMIEVFNLLDDRYELNLMLLSTDDPYLESLKERSAKSDNIIFHDPVPTHKIPEFINQFDISFIIIPPVNFNYRYGMGNKFFESIQARLMLLSGGSIEACEMIKKHKLGVALDSLDSENIAKKIRSLDRKEIQMYKDNTHSGAKIFSADKTYSYLQEMVSRLLN